MKLNECHCGIVTIVTLLDTFITIPSSNNLVILTLPRLHGYIGYPLLTDKIPDGLSAKCEVQQLPR